MKKIIIVFVVLVAVVIGGYFVFKKPVVPAPAVITIDASQSLGKFSPYLFGHAGSPKTMTDESIELARSAGYKLALVYTRIGDGTNCDNSLITAEDTQIDALLKAGIEPMPIFDPLKKPANLDTYATCVKKTGKHLFDKGVKIFRFSNEPDGNWTDWGKKKGEQSDPIDVAQTYEAWAKALKSVDKSIIVEGPAIMILTEKGQIADWVKKFLNYLSERNAPLDIFSFHIYSASPYAYYKQFNIAKKELQKHKISPLYGVPRIGNDEWLMKIGDFWSDGYSEEFDMTWAASAQLNGLINMIEEGAVLSMPTFGISIEQDVLCHDFLPISCSGKAKPVFYAFQAFNQLAETNRLTTSGTDKINFAAISGVKEAGGDKQIIIILSNYDVSSYSKTYPVPVPVMNGMAANDSAIMDDIKNAKVYKNIELKIENSPWNSSQIIAVKRYLIDDNNALVLSEKNGQSITVANDGSISLSAEISAPQVQIITLALKGKPSLFSIEPALSPDENYGKLDVKGKQTFEKSQNKPIEPVGKCGNNICDEFEKANPNACPQDCAVLPSSSSSAKTDSKCDINKDGKVDSFEKEICSQEPPAQTSSNTESPFGFHPGNAENYSYIKDLGAKWSREGYYLMWNWVDKNRDGNYKFTQAEAPAVANSSFQGQKINYDAQWLNVPQNIEITANICPFGINIFSKEKGFSDSKELETYGDFAKNAVERYDGDDDYGCEFSSPDCYKKGDNQYPSAETIKYFQKKPIKYWQVCNQLTEVSASRNDYVSTFASIQEKTYKSVKEASPSSQVLIAGDSSKELYTEVFNKLGGKYIDIIDIHRFGNNYNPKEDFDYIKSKLRSAGFDTNKLKFWMTETGTYSGDPSSDADKNLPSLTEKQQASVLVKIYVSGLSYGIEKIFWAWNIVEGFTRDGGIFDYTGLVYDGCDYVNSKYECGSNIGYDKGKGVKKLGYYTYKKMVETLDGSDWNNIQTVQEKDGVYVYKFVKNGKPIWVAWNDNDTEKQIMISGINSSSIKITEAVAKYESGQEVSDYNTAFKTEIKKTPDNKADITISDVPMFVEEI